MVYQRAAIKNKQRQGIGTEKGHKDRDRDKERHRDRHSDSNLKITVLRWKQVTHIPTDCEQYVDWLKLKSLAASFFVFEEVIILSTSLSSFLILNHYLELKWNL